MFPIYLKKISHWVLVCADLKSKELKYFDSLHSYNYDIQLKILEYLIKIHDVEKVGPFCTDHWSLKQLKNSLIPQQKNDYDCGVFVCTFAEYLARGAKFNFSQTHMGLFRQLILYEPLKKQIVSVDVDTEEVGSFIRKALNW
ncbi:sentrin-specific protease-like [Aphis craccivora]|uniref:Sentrin-specific protease-like n=1 Tax=Aphis craccivora TaxID=307492 RepID=A0A6G0W7Y3_APHCR|nr:sentrin-specific protease-like [Aphis craccivora]